MDPSIANLNLAPPRQRVYARGMLPALIAHVLLGLALASGVQWKRTPDPSRTVSVPGLVAPAESAVASAALPLPASPPASPAVEPQAPPAPPLAQTAPARVPVPMEATPTPPVIAEPEPPGRIAMGAAAERPDPRTPARPSFDCAKARSSPERIICADPELSRMDRELGRLHARAKAAAPDPGAFKRQNDAEWRLRESACRDRECLLAWYGNRREQLLETLAEAGARTAR